MDDRVSDNARVSPEPFVRSRRTKRASAALDKAFGLLVIAALTVSGFGIVGGLIYAAVAWSLLALIPLILYLTAWLLVARG